VLACLVLSGLYLWQTSGSVGRAAQLRNSTAELESELARLKRIHEQATRERSAVALLEEQFGYLYDDVFGSLEARLTEILRAVGQATRETGLLPSSFSYSASEDKTLRHVRFGIQFAVIGQYTQIRRLLAALQASPQFLIVEHIGFAGEEEATVRELSISLKLATVFTEADEELLRRLTGGIRRAESTDDG
jgi:Tfp pilus assembly protein PilO